MYTVEDSQEIATIFSTVQPTLDIFAKKVDLKKARAMISDMKSNAGAAMSLAVVFGSTDKADIRSAEAEVFEAFIDLIEARSKQMDVAEKQHSDNQTLGSLEDLF